MKLITVLYLLLAAALFNSYMSWQNYPGHNFYLTELSFAVVPLVGIVLLKFSALKLPAWAETFLAARHQSCSVSTNESAPTAWLLPWLCNPFIAVSIWLAVILVLGAKDTRLPPGSAVPSSASFPLVVPNPANPQGPPMYIGADKLVEFRAQNPGATLAIPPTEKSVIRSGNQYVVYSAHREGDAMLVQVAIHPDQPDTSRIGHFYTRRSLYRIDESGINALAYKHDIPRVEFGGSGILLFILWLLPATFATRSFAIRRLRQGPPFSRHWMLLWGGWMRFAEVPISWAPIIAALQATNAETWLPSPKERRLARIDHRAAIRIRFPPKGGFIAFFDAGRVMWAAPLLTLVGPVALLIAIDDVVSAHFDPLLPALSPVILASLCLLGFSALIVGLRLLRASDLGAEANRLATILGDEAAKLGCERVPVKTSDDLKWT